jgi:hypothetical protein
MTKLDKIVNGLDITEAEKYLYLEIGDARKFKIDNQLLSNIWDDHNKTAEMIVKLCRDPKYLHFVCKYILNVNLAPIQLAALQTLWRKPLVLFVGGRGVGKSFIMAIYLILKMLLHQGCKIVVVGASLRQSMVIFNYVQKIWDDASILRDICGNEYPKRDIHMCHWKVGKSSAAWLPMGDGSKIRGQRANVVISDETASIPIEIFETVVRGFASVKSEGTFHSIQQAYIKKYRESEEAGLISKTAGSNKSVNTKLIMDSNQIIMAGTAYYRFNHFFKYYSYYKSIMINGGKKDVLQKEFPDKPITSDIDPSNYAILRIPADFAPLGMMDTTILGQGKVTMDPLVYQMEYDCIFPADSDGFYLASWLQKSTCPIRIDDNMLNFGTKLVGDKDKEYIMGIDPASEQDRFVISLLEDNGRYRSLVYMWSTNRKEFEQLKRDPLQPIKEEIKDYNTFVLIHIRDLLHRFNVKLIVMDAAGGGVSVREGLRDPSKFITESDVPIYDMDDVNVRGLSGKHILKMIQFSDYDWLVKSHYALRSDLMDTKIIFPLYDAAEIELCSFKDSQIGKGFDKMEDCYLEIENCKKETAMIQHEQTTTGREKWDVPKIMGIDADMARKKMKRDRFISLLLANWGFRFLTDNKDENTRPTFFGGVAQQLKGNPVSGVPYVGKGANRLKHMPEYNLSPHQVIETTLNPNRKIFF